MFLKALKDSVHAVRMAAVKEASAFCRIFGNEWSTTAFIPQILNEFSSKSGHCIRLTVLQAIVPLGEVLNGQQTETILAPTFLKALGDSVPNVKYRACKLTMTFCRDSEMRIEFIRDQIRPAVEKVIAETGAGEVQSAGYAARDAIDHIIKAGRSVPVPVPT
ncbi:unnamed protein product [Amoebophrya sp. A25]|nr:unnamed protein product [Amoebophrya sp. A25]|eukprot:GSA25T00022209001.1